MADINYSKAEKEVEKAVQNTKVKSLVEGKSVTSKRAMDFYALEEESPRPAPEDRVERLISETAAQEEEKEKEEKKQKHAQPTSKAEGPSPLPSPEKVPEEDEQLEEEFEIITEIPHSDTIRKARKLSPRIPQQIAPPLRKVPPSERYLEKPSPLLVLRKHILWFKRQHIEDRYERLGTTKDEVFLLRKAERLTNKQLERA